MKYSLFLFLSLSVFLFSYSQEQEDTSESIKSPIYPGCENSPNIKCLNYRINRFISKNFSPNLDHLNLSGHYRFKLLTYLLVTKEGDIKLADIEYKSSNISEDIKIILYSAVKQLVPKFPKIIPAVQNDEPIEIQLVIPLTYVYDGDYIKVAHFKDCSYNNDLKSCNEDFLDRFIKEQLNKTKATISKAITFKLHINKKGKVISVTYKDNTNKDDLNILKKILKKLPNLFPYTKNDIKLPSTLEYTFTL